MASCGPTGSRPGLSGCRGGIVASGAAADEPHIELFDDETRNVAENERCGRERRSEVIHHPATDTANEVLVRLDRGIEPRHASGRAHAAHEPLALERLEDPVYGGLRERLQLGAGPSVHGLRRRVAVVGDEGAVDGEPLRGEPQTAGPGTGRELGAAPGDHRRGPPRRVSAIGSHMRMITI